MVADMHLNRTRISSQARVAGEFPAVSGNGGMCSSAPAALYAVWPESVEGGRMIYAIAYAAALKATSAPPARFAAQSN